MNTDTRQEYLKSLKWDGVERIDDWLVKYFGAEDTPDNRDDSRDSLMTFIDLKLFSVFGSRARLMLEVELVGEDLNLPVMHQDDLRSQQALLRGRWFVGIHVNDTVEEQFNVMSVSDINLRGFERDRDQLLAEAAAVRVKQLREGDARRYVSNPPKALREFAKALSCRADALYHDDDDDCWLIGGSHGHIHLTPGGFEIFVLDTAMYDEVKKMLTFAESPQGYSDLRKFFLNHLPTFKEAETIRRLCGIRGAW